MSVHRPSALRRTALLLVVVLLLGLGIGPGVAATATGPDRESPGLLNVTAWRTADGLPHNMVHAIAQTPDGYLWIGTWEGLVRFNGYEFRVFTPENTPALTDRAVRALAVSPDGSLWIGTAGGGVVRYHQGRWYAYRASDGLASNEVLSLHAGDDGRVWVGSEASGVSVIEDSGISVIDRSRGLADDTIVRMAMDRSGRLWIISRNHVMTFDGQAVVVFGTADGLPAVPPLSVDVAPDGTIRVGSEAGLFRWQGERFEPDPAARSLAHESQVARIVATADGELWVGTIERGLHRLQDGARAEVDTRGGLPNNRITALHVDLEGSLWVGTSAGLARVRSGIISALTLGNGLSDDYVRAVWPLDEGGAWIATSNGLNRYRGGRFEAWTIDDGLPGNSLLSLLAEQDGTLWVGTYGGGLARLDAAGRVSAHDAPELPSSQVRSLLRSRSGDLWIGTIRGAVRWHRDGQELLTTATGLSRDFVSMLAEDTDHGVWIGGLGALARWVDGELQQLDVLPGFGGAQVFGMAETGDGELWLATDDGLRRFDGDHFERIGAEHGLPHEALFGVVPDSAGNLWLSANVGLFRVKVADLRSIADGNVSTLQVDHFTEDHGLASRQANGGSTPSMRRGADGRIWMATARGAAVIDPTGLDRRLEPAPPQTVQIETLLVDGSVTDTTETVRIVPGTRHLEFHYAGLRLAGAEALEYRYRLVGYDDDWREAGRSRSAHYTNLDPGDYRFEVMAGVGNAWRISERSVALVIEPHFYETGWFLALLALVATLLLWAGITLRIAALRQRASELSAEVAARTADLRERSEELERVADERSRLLTQLEQQSRAFERQAREDSLTGLPNRRRYDERIRDAYEAVLRRGGHLAVILADVDHFKQINDRFSHQVGDDVLRRLGEILRAWSERIVGFTASRYGGEEFAVLALGHEPGDVVRLCDGLRAAVEEDAWSDIADGLTVTLSIGICADDLRGSYERMLIRADRALYRSKAEGRNRTSMVTGGP